MELTLHAKLRKALEREAADARISLHALIVKKLEANTAPPGTISLEAIQKALPELTAFLKRIPGVAPISEAVTPDGFWWIKLQIDITHALAWHVVQNLGFVLNYISINERLPTVFMPVAPPPYLNDGDPESDLAWVIESKYGHVDPRWILGELEARLPNPVEDHDKWQ